MEKGIHENNISQFNKGLYLDNSIIDSPKGSYRFALNAINETELGNAGFISNEESNKPCGNIPQGFIPIGKVYIGNNKTVIFLVSENNMISEIGILHDCEYTTVVNDLNSSLKNKLNFSSGYQIQATYRLRKGCEDTIYFTDGLNTPRYFNFNKPEQFKTGSFWNATKFELFRKLNTFPTLDKVEVVDNLGNLTPGSYTVLVQHLDEDLNGTEFYELVKDINIYNTPLNRSYADIEGSSHVESEDNSQAYLYSNTNKAIKITLDNVDRSFSYVRFAFVERTSGNGEISAVKYSGVVNVYNPTYIYTGDNASTLGTKEEVELFNLGAGINAAKHVEQIDNMLILSNTIGEQAKMCELQKYASKVNVDCFVQDTILTSIKDRHNSKNPLVSHYGMGYQPGEIYSLGLIYIFEDYSVSPVMHIPGKSPLVSNTHVFAQGAKVYPMSNINNTNTSELYIDENSSCADKNYWGVDSQGTTLRNTTVRHHRFPTRKDLNLDFVKRINSQGSATELKNIQLSILGQVKVSDEQAVPPYAAPNFSLIVKYKRNGVEESFQDSVFPDSGIKPTNVNSNVFLNTDTITDLKLFYQEFGSEEEVEIVLTNGSSEEQDNNLTYSISIQSSTENNESYIYKAPILGIRLSNIQFPSEIEIGKKIIGYQIVRQERTEQDKTILDSAVAFPMLKSGRNVSTGLLAPEFWKDTSMTESTCEGSENGEFPTCYNVSKKNLMLITPGHKFMDKTYDEFTTIEQVGSFKKEYVSRSGTSTQNVYEGTSASGDEDKKTDDGDGFSLRHGYRFTGVEYQHTINNLTIQSQNTRTYNLDALNYAESEGGDETLYNLACDNKALVVSTSDTTKDLRTYRPGKQEFPYMYIKKYSETFYQNFRSNPYYLADTRIFSAHTTEVFGGDVHIAPLRYSNHIFGNVGVGMRRKRLSAWVVIGAVIVALVGAALAIFSGGSSLLIAGGIITSLGAIATGAAAFVEVARFTEIYSEKWEANLDRTVFDYFYAALFIREYPHLDNSDKDWWYSRRYLAWEDDTFRWFGDIVGDLWFETQLNISLRVPPKTMENNYLKPLKPYMSDGTNKWRSLTWNQNVDWVDTQTLQGNGFHRFQDATVDATLNEEWYFIKKITKPDSSRTSGLLYQGISTPQIYMVNPDHHVTTGIKKYYSIPLEYDCCSDCIEKFPHRIYYSQQSFQEEKADNYRIFLPNNYRDIEGETGEITNIFRLYSNLFVHTKEGLWKMGRKYQERVTDNIVSFIGTGSYFETPPDKVVDDDTGNSAGTQHKWSGIKTPNGYFFVSANQKKIYQFTGESLKPISDLGLSNWFKNNIEIQGTGSSDNPSHKMGTGFISGYDSRKERILFTKIDTIGRLNNSWTMSFSLKNNSWVSWHSYLPNFYINIPEKLFSWKTGTNNFWIHNVLGSYQTYYGTHYPHILEGVKVSNPVTTKIYNTIMLQTEAKTYDNTLKEYVEDRYITFNKAIIYNSRQCSGEMNLVVKNTTLDGLDYMSNQVLNNNNNTSIIDRTEKDWFINDFRDIRVDYSKPIWNSELNSVQSNYYIDKVLNTSTMNINKDWTQLENFRDKYLVVRLIFDNFANKKLITNFSVENEQQSFH